MIDYRLSVLVLEGIDDKAIKLNLNEIIYIYINDQLSFISYL